VQGRSGGFRVRIALISSMDVGFQTDGARAKLWWIFRKFKLAR
jgi:hypothetical protein